MCSRFSSFFFLHTGSGTLHVLFPSCWFCIHTPSIDGRMFLTAAKDSIQFMAYFAVRFFLALIRRSSSYMFGSCSDHVQIMFRSCSDHVCSVYLHVQSMGMTSFFTSRCHALAFQFVFLHCILRTSQKTRMGHFSGQNSWGVLGCDRPRVNNRIPRYTINKMDVFYTFPPRVRLSMAVSRIPSTCNIRVVIAAAFVHDQN